MLEAEVEVLLALVLELELGLELGFLVLEARLALVLELEVLDLLEVSVILGVVLGWRLLLPLESVVLILGWMVLGCLEILLEVLAWYAESVASGVSVVLKAGLLELILSVLCFPKAVILWLVRLLTLEVVLLLVGLRFLGS